jgi:hypothetical protein
MLVIGGNFKIAGSTTANRVAAWDGMQWQPLGAIPSEVYALAVHNGQLVAGLNQIGPGARAVVRWNGQTWQPLGVSLSGRVDTLAVYNGDLIAGGQLHECGRSNRQQHRTLGWLGVACDGKRRVGMGLRAPRAQR